MCRTLLDTMRRFCTIIAARSAPWPCNRICFHHQATISLPAGGPQPSPGVAARGSSPGANDTPATSAGIALGAASIAPTWSLLEAAACGRCLLQSHIDSWLDSQPMQLPHDSSCCKETSGAMKDVRGTAAAGAVDPQAVAALLLMLRRVRLWSAGCYAGKLLADGVMDDADVVVSERGGAAAAAAALVPAPALLRAAQHWVILKALHPRALTDADECHGIGIPISIGDVHTERSGLSSCSYAGLRKRLLRRCAALLQLQPRAVQTKQSTTPQPESRGACVVWGIGRQMAGALRCARAALSWALIQSASMDRREGCDQDLTSDPEMVAWLQFVGGSSGVQQGSGVPAATAGLVLAWLGAQPISVRHAFGAEIWRIVTQQMAVCGGQGGGFGADLANEMRRDGWAQQLRQAVERVRGMACAAAKLAMRAQTARHTPAYDSHAVHTTACVSTPDLPVPVHPSVGARSAAGVTGTQHLAAASAPATDPSQYQQQQSWAGTDVGACSVNASASGGFLKVSDAWLQLAVTLLDASGHINGAADLALALLQHQCSAAGSGGTAHGEEQGAVTTATPPSAGHQQHAPSYAQSRSWCGISCRVVLDLIWALRPRCVGSL